MEQKRIFSDEIRLHGPSGESSKVPPEGTGSFLFELEPDWHGDGNLNRFIL